MCAHMRACVRVCFHLFTPVCTVYTYPLAVQTSAMNMLPEAFVHLGQAYEEGRGCEVDIDEAVRCYRRGVELEHPLAYLELARCHTAGTGVEKSDEEAFKLHLKAAEAGESSQGGSVGGGGGRGDCCSAPVIAGRFC